MLGTESNESLPCAAEPALEDELRSGESKGQRAAKRINLAPAHLQDRLLRPNKFRLSWPSLLSDFAHERFGEWCLV